MKYKSFPRNSQRIAAGISVILFGFIPNIVWRTYDTQCSQSWAFGSVYCNSQLGHGLKVLIDIVLFLCIYVIVKTVCNHFAANEAQCTMSTIASDARALEEMPEPTSEILSLYNDGMQREALAAYLSVNPSLPGVEARERLAYAARQMWRL